MQIHVAEIQIVNAGCSIDKNLFAMLDAVVARPVAGLRLTHCHHLLLALLLKFHLDKIVLIAVRLLMGRARWRLTHWPLYALIRNGNNFDD